MCKIFSPTVQAKKHQHLVTVFNLKSGSMMMIDVHIDDTLIKR